MNTINRCISDQERSPEEWFSRAGVRFELHGDPSLTRPAKLQALTHDSRAVRPGDVFVAVRGGSVDGHDFIQQAAQRGASVAVVERLPATKTPIPLVMVEDSRQALARLSAAFTGLRSASSEPMRLIGVTGTNGKTTVTWMLRSILQQAGYATALLGTIEYDLCGPVIKAPLTTPGAIELCTHLAAAGRRGARWGVLEASSHALDQRRCDGLSFAAAVFTNLSGDHLDYHGTMETYGQAKRRLFDLLEDDGVAVVNRDDPWSRCLPSPLEKRVRSFALDDDRADLRATVHQERMTGTVFSIAGSGKTDFPAPSAGTWREIRCPLIGRHNVSNALAAISTAHALGIAPDKIRVGIETLRGIPGRLQRVESPGCPFTVLVDYAHTDAALDHALATLRPLTRGRLICVFGCGGDRDRTKRSRMAKAAARWSDVAVVTSDNPRTEDPQKIIDEILPGFDRCGRGRVITQVDRRRAIESALQEARPGDTVLIAGKGHEDYQLVGDMVLAFDDVEVAVSCLSAMACAGEVV